MDFVLNSSSVLNKLNSKCEHRHDNFFNKWTDTDIENGYHRTYCYHAYSSFDLCSSCENTLTEFQLQQNGLSGLFTLIEELREEINIIKEKININYVIPICLDIKYQNN